MKGIIIKNKEGEFKLEFSGEFLVLSSNESSSEGKEPIKKEKKKAEPVVEKKGGKIKCKAGRLDLTPDKIYFINGSKSYTKTGKEVAEKQIEAIKNNYKFMMAFVNSKTNSVRYADNPFYDKSKPTYDPWNRKNNAKGKRKKNRVIKPEVVNEDDYDGLVKLNQNLNE
jgi:hypothetical protein